MKVGKEPPKFIYLQWDEEDNDEITWCDERIMDSDVKYMLVREKPGECPHGYENHDECVDCRH